MMQLFKKSAIFVCALGLMARPMMAPSETLNPLPIAVNAKRFYTQTAQGWMLVDRVNGSDLYCAYSRRRLNGAKISRSWADPNLPHKKCLIEWEANASIDHVPKSFFTPHPFDNIHVDFSSDTKARDMFSQMDPAYYNSIRGNDFYKQKPWYQYIPQPAPSPHVQPHPTPSPAPQPPVVHPIPTPVPTPAPHVQPHVQPPVVVNALPHVQPQPHPTHPLAPQPPVVHPIPTPAPTPAPHVQPHVQPPVVVNALPHVQPHPTPSPAPQPPVVHPIPTPAPTPTPHVQPHVQPPVVANPLPHVQPHPTPSPAPQPPVVHPIPTPASSPTYPSASAGSTPSPSLTTTPSATTTSPSTTSTPSPSVPTSIPTTLPPIVGSTPPPASISITQQSPAPSITPSQIQHNQKLIEEQRKADEARTAEEARLEAERKKNEAKQQARNRVIAQKAEYAQGSQELQQLLATANRMTDPEERAKKLADVQTKAKALEDLAKQIKENASQADDPALLQESQRLIDEAAGKKQQAKKLEDLAKNGALYEKASKLARRALKDPLSPDETETGLPWLDDGSWTFPEEASEAIKNSDLEKEDKDVAERILHFVEALANLSEDETKNLALNRLADTDCIRRCSPETATTINGGNANKEAKYLLSNKNIELLLCAALVDLDALSELGDENSQNDAAAAKNLVAALNKLVHDNPGIHKILLEPLDGNDGSNNLISAATKISGKLRLEAPTRVDVATAFVKDNPVIIGTGCAGVGLVLTIAGLAARVAWLIEKAYQAQLNEPKPKDRQEVAVAQAQKWANSVEQWWKKLREKPATPPKPVAKKAAEKAGSVKLAAVKKPTPRTSAKPKRAASTSPRRKTTSPARKATPTKRPASAVRKTRGAKRVGAKG